MCSRSRTTIWPISCGSSSRWPIIVASIISSSVKCAIVRSVGRRIVRVIRAVVVRHLSNC
ncbi:unnamed protein product [Moneuplotes crassus]|uniref:Uncharacterized protein n=1 Tax=Euplotes crassus TaxID=5936 RepID=A0AAD2D5C7_EUPCR|nr:unnamed protein product [Moneuplotes crassus]